MAKAITFNVDGLIKKLDLIEKVYLKEAAEQALKSFGFEARELIQREMDSKYQSVSAYTRRSPYFRQNGLQLTIGISDKRNNGISPAQYLAPTDASQGRFKKPTAPTSLDGAMLARYGIRDIAVPVVSSRAGSQFLNARGALRSRKVERLLDQLQDPGSSKEQYFVVRPGSGGRLTPGVFRRYRVKSEISSVFTFARQTTKPVLDFEGVVTKAAQHQIPKLIQTKLSRLLAQG